MTERPAWEQLIRTVPDFPVAGVQFKDITPLLADGSGLQAVINTLVERYRDQKIDAVVGIESRGFIFGAPVAYALGTGLALVRKPGKLPAATFGIEYELEYGSNRLEIHQDALQPGARVVIIDDVLATGGTAAATAHLVEQIGATIVEVAFVIELEFLHGREKLASYPMHALLTY